MTLFIKISKRAFEADLLERGDDAHEPRCAGNAGFIVGRPINI